MKVVEDIKFEPITEGVIPDGVTSHYVAPKAAVENAENFHNDTLGVMTFRQPLYTSFVPGATDYWSGVLFDRGASGSMYIYYQTGTSLCYEDPMIPSGITTFTTVFPAGYTTRFSIIQGTLLMTTGSTAQIKYTDGISAPANIAGVTGVPSVDLINAGFVGRIWYADSTSSNNRLYYTDVIPAAGVASTTGTSQYLTINAGNGDVLSGLVQGQQTMFVFTRNSVFRVYNTQNQDSVPCATVGALTQESIVTASDGIYFYHPSGFYKLSENGSAQCISNRIATIIPNPGKISAETCKSFSYGDHVYFSFEASFPNGSSTATGTLLYRYTISTQVWTIYKFFKVSTKVAVAAIKRNGRIVTMLMGNTSEANARFASNFYEFTGDGSQSSTTPIDDNGTTQIIGSYNTHWEDFGAEGHLKKINGISFPQNNAAGFDVSYQIDTDNADHWTPIGRMDSRAVTVFKDFVSRPFNRIKFRVMGQKKTQQAPTYCWIGSPTIMKLTDMGYQTEYE